MSKRSPFLVARGVSWCHGGGCLLPGPAPAGAGACGPSQARAAQYRSKCNALSRSARAPPTLSSHSALGPTVQAVPPGSAWAHAQCLQFCQK